MMNLLGLFKNHKEEYEFSAGQLIFEQGKPGDTLYIILEGEVDLKKNGKSIYKAVAGEMFGEMALIDANARSATAIANTNVRCIPIDENQFLFMVRNTPNFALHVMRVLVERIRFNDP